MSGGTTTLQLRDRIEAAGYQFLKDKAGWACYDADDRTEVQGSRHNYYGESVWLASKRLNIGE
jgi:hypothetical protein